MSEALYRCPLQEFVSQRKALANQLKAAGQRDEAERVRGLSKPSLVAWLVNQLYHERRSAWDEALAAGAELRSAQAQGGHGAGDVQLLITAHRRCVQQLQQLALELAQAAGLGVNRVHERQLQDTLEAVATGAVQSAQYGRLTQGLAPGGFDALSTAQLLSARPPASASAGETQAGVLPRSEGIDFGQEARRRRAQGQERLQQALQRAQSHEAACLQRWEAARQQQGETRRHLDDVEAQRVVQVQQRQLAYQALERAQAALSAAQERLEAVEAQVNQARDATRHASERVSSAEQALAAAEAARRSAEQAARMGSGDGS